MVRSQGPKKLDRSSLRFFARPGGGFTVTPVELITVSPSFHVAVRVIAHYMPLVYYETIKVGILFYILAQTEKRGFGTEFAERLHYPRRDTGGGTVVESEEHAPRIFVGIEAPT